MPFCEGKGRVMFPGYQTSYDASSMPRMMKSTCMLYLFQGAVVDTKAKYAGVIVITFLLPVLMALLDTGRALLSAKVEGAIKSERGWTKLQILGVDMATSLLTGATIMISYLLMLLVMMYEAWIFTAMIVGLTMGMFASSIIKQRWLQEACGCQRAPYRALNDD